MNLGRRVVVIGGGFVAFDAARMALRLASPDADAELAAAADARVKEALDSARAAVRGGAAEVTIVSLESFDEMPVLRTTQGREEFEEAKREGVRFVTRRGPMEFLGGARLEAVALRRVVSVFDADGRFSPSYDDSDVETIGADACIRRARLADAASCFTADSFAPGERAARSLPCHSGAALRPMTTGLRVRGGRRSGLRDTRAPSARKFIEASSFSSKSSEEMIRLNHSGALVSGRA